MRKYSCDKILPNIYHVGHAVFAQFLNTKDPNTGSNWNLEVDFHGWKKMGEPREKLSKHREKILLLLITITSTAAQLAFGWGLVEHTTCASKTYLIVPQAEVCTNLLINL